jgi:hypothetical protein
VRDPGQRFTGATRMVSGSWVMLDAKIEPPERNHFEIPPREKIPVWIKEEEKFTEVVLPMAAVGQGHRPLHRCLNFNYPSDALTSVSIRCATTSGCSTKLLFRSITPGIRISGRAACTCATPPIRADGADWRIRDSSVATPGFIENS